MKLLACLVTIYIHPASAEVPTNVIFITLDGIRWQDFFYGVRFPYRTSERGENFPYLKNILGQEGFIFGDPETNDWMSSSNSRMISLPAYQSIFAGVEQPECRNNNCGRTSAESFVERLVRENTLKKEEVATFSSWENIQYAIESKQGSVNASSGLDWVNDSIEDDELFQLNLDQFNHPPLWKKARQDQYTFRFALRNLRVHHPRFLYIALNDSDEWGHRNSYSNYTKTLRQYDRWIEELDQTLKGMGDYGKNTALIITTDHGRGTELLWFTHGPHVARSSRPVWLYMKLPENLAQTSVRTEGQRQHADIRPTIETLFGLNPLQQKGEPLFRSR